MKKFFRTITILFVLFLFSCDNSSGSSSHNSHNDNNTSQEDNDDTQDISGITDDYKAETAFTIIKYICEDFEYSLGASESISANVEGITGSAYITGTKSVDNYDTSYSYTTTTSTTIEIEFRNYSDSYNTTLNGKVSYHYYYYYRYAYSGASSTHENGSISGTSLSISYAGNYDKFTDVINIDISDNDSYSSYWDGTITNAAGTVFKIYGKY